MLRKGIAGSLTDNELAELVGDRIDRYRHLGNTDAKRGTAEWRTLARALCIAEYEALARTVERDEGDYGGRPTTPMLIDAQPPSLPQEALSLKKLWDDYKTSRTQAGFMRDGGKRQNPVIDILRKFLKHNDARRITKKDLLAWRDHLMTDLSGKTVNDVYLSTVRSLFSWAVENERMQENPAVGVRQPKARKVSSREKGFTDDEALAVLNESQSYEPKANQFGHISETPQNVAAKRWAPILCAFTGARISEITQLRKEDVRQEGGRWIIRITPEAGTVKAGGYRDVLLHRQVEKIGFIDFVTAAKAGPLFHDATDPAKYATGARVASGKVSEWLRLTKAIPEGIQPIDPARKR